VIYTHLRSVKVFRICNHVRHRNDRLTESGGIAILVYHSLDNHSVPVQGLEHLDANAIQDMLGSKPVKILAVTYHPLDSSLLRTLRQSSPNGW